MIVKFEPNTIKKQNKICKQHRSRILLGEKKVNKRSVRAVIALVLKFWFVYKLFKKNFRARDNVRCAGAAFYKAFFDIPD